MSKPKCSTTNIYIFLFKFDLNRGRLFQKSGKLTRRPKRSIGSMRSEEITSTVKL